MKNEGKNKKYFKKDKVVIAILLLFLLLFQGPMNMFVYAPIVDAQTLTNENIYKETTSTNTNNDYSLNKRPISTIPLYDILPTEKVLPSNNESKVVENDLNTMNISSNSTLEVKLMETEILEIENENIPLNDFPDIDFDNRSENTIITELVPDSNIDDSQIQKVHPVPIIEDIGKDTSSSSSNNDSIWNDDNNSSNTPVEDIEPIQPETPIIPDNSDNNDSDIEDKPVDEIPDNTNDPEVNVPDTDIPDKDDSDDIIIPDDDISDDSNHNKPEIDIPDEPDIIDPSPEVPDKEEVPDVEIPVIPDEEDDTNTDIDTPIQPEDPTIPEEPETPDIEDSFTPPFYGTNLEVTLQYARYSMIEFNEKFPSNDGFRRSFANYIDTALTLDEDMQVWVNDNLNIKNNATLYIQPYFVKNNANNNYSVILYASIANVVTGNAGDKWKAMLIYLPNDDYTDGTWYITTTENQYNHQTTGNIISGFYNKDYSDVVNEITTSSNWCFIDEYGMNEVPDETIIPENDKIMIEDKENTDSVDSENTIDETPTPEVDNEDEKPEDELFDIVEDSELIVDTEPTEENNTPINDGSTNEISSSEEIFEEKELVEIESTIIDLTI